MEIKNSSNKESFSEYATGKHIENFKGPKLGISSTDLQEAICELCSLSLGYPIPMSESNHEPLCESCKNHAMYITSLASQQLKALSSSNEELRINITELGDITKESLNNSREVEEETYEITKLDNRIREIEHEILEILQTSNERQDELLSVTGTVQELRMINTQKSEQIERLTNKLSKKRKGLESFQRDSSANLAKYTGAFAENRKLKKIIQESEQEFYFYTLQIADALEIVKHQIVVEECENAEIKKKTDSLFREELLKESLKTERNNVEELNQELAELKLLIEKVNSENQHKENEKDSQDEPAATPCNCIII